MLRNSSFCDTLLDKSNRTKNAIQGIVPSLQLGHVYLTFLILTLMSIILAKGFNLIRKYVYRDKENLDTDFDAGGKVSVGLTATTIVSQWTWAATLLQSCTVAAKYGISGPFWYAAGATIQILLFAMISVQLKIRAPGAKTFLRVIQARFGRKTHITYCVFALLTNIIVTAMLMLGGAAVMVNLVKNLSIELATGLVVLTTATYTFIGGLGATFYVSYVNTAFIYIFMLIFLMRVYQAPSADLLGSVDQMYDYLSCSVGPEGNKEGSYLTLVSHPGLMFGIINIVVHICTRSLQGSESEQVVAREALPWQSIFWGDLTNFQWAGEYHLHHAVISMIHTIVTIASLLFAWGNFGTVFVDQSYWQSSVAAKPKQGVWGFLSGGLSWFAVPFTFATTMGLAYIVLGAEQGGPLLSDEDVDMGLVAPVVAQRLMGTSGEILIMLMILMAVTSTGSAEIMAVTSIFIYDIYQLYLKPYRLVLDANTCILCGKQRGRNAHPRDKCICNSMTYCRDCSNDDEQREMVTRLLKPPYKCKVHGMYRTYNDYLLRRKNWCLLLVSISIIPLTMILSALNVSLGWVYLFMGVLIGSAVVPITLSMVWSRLTSVAMMSGAIGGAFIGLTSWLIVSSQQTGGLRDFFKSTGAEVSMLTGNLCSILSGGLISIVMTFITNWHYSQEMDTEIWENTRDIDNPLSPWTELYARDLGLTGANRLDNRPSLLEVAKAFTSAKRIAYVGALVLTFVLIIVWPAIMTAVGVMGSTSFSVWVGISAVWGFIAAIFIISFPLISEAWEIRRTLQETRAVGDDTQSTSTQQSPVAKFNGKTNCFLVTNVDSPAVRDIGNNDIKQDVQRPTTSIGKTNIDIRTSDGEDNSGYDDHYVVGQMDTGSTETQDTEPRAPIF